MNRIEQMVYNALKRNPNAKLRVRNVYQRVLDTIPVATLVASYPITVREGFYFGFHDKCPWSADNSMLLANRFDIPLRMPRPEDRITVGYFTGEEHQIFNPVAET